MRSSSRLVVVTGGARSGKSAFAERLAAQLAAASQSGVTYVATAEARDAEMAARIALHRRRRPASWRTVEAPRDAVGALQAAAPHDVVLLDCVTLFVANWLAAEAEADRVDLTGSDALPVEIQQVLAERVAEGAEALVAAAARRPGWTVLVTNEVGWGVVPPTPLGRLYRDVAGQVNRLLADAAQAVYLVVAGQAVEVKALSLAPEEAAARLVAGADTGSGAGPFGRPPEPQRPRAAHDNGGRPSGGGGAMKGSGGR